MSEQTIGVEQQKSGQDASMRLVRVALDAIAEDPNHERKTYLEMEGFTETIRTQGMLHPPIVTPELDGLSYCILDGHRRVRAARALGWSEIDVLVHEPVDARSRRLKSLLSSIQHQPLQPVDMAEAFDAVMKAEGDPTEEQLAKLLGKGTYFVKAMKAILRLPPLMYKRLKEADFYISWDAASRVARRDDAKERSYLFEMLMAGASYTELRAEMARLTRLRRAEVQQHRQKIGQFHFTLTVPRDADLDEAEAACKLFVEHFHEDCERLRQQRRAQAAAKAQAQAQAQAQAESRLAVGAPTPEPVEELQPAPEPIEPVEPAASAEPQPVDQTPAQPCLTEPVAALDASLEDVGASTAEQIDQPQLEPLAPAAIATATEERAETQAECVQEQPEPADTPLPQAEPAAAADLAAPVTQTEQPPETPAEEPVLSDQTQKVGAPTLEPLEELQPEPAPKEPCLTEPIAALDASLEDVGAPTPEPPTAEMSQEQLLALFTDDL